MTLKPIKKPSSQHSGGQSSRDFLKPVLHRLSKLEQQSSASEQPQRPSPAELNAAHHEAILDYHTSRPTALQRQVAAPVLTAARLQRQEEQRLNDQRTPLQRQAAELGQGGMPAHAYEAAMQRQTQQQAALVAPTRPQSPGYWVTVMRAHAQHIEAKNDGPGLNSREVAQLTTLQRQVSMSLASGFKQDRSPAAERYASYADHLVTLQRHPLTFPVVRGTLNLINPSERPSLQRAVDEAVQREAVQHQQDTQALQLHSVQRQLAELDEQANQSVMQRIQARRGGGNPLPTAIQRHLEQGLNHDLSAVRIHDDTEADKLAKGVNAMAFTTGTDIFFQRGKYEPNSQSGLELLAHEVTHTVQQSKGHVGKGIDPDAGLESEARHMGAKLSKKLPKAQFGTHAKRPGSNTKPRQSLQRAVTADPISIQRWGLGDLKKAAQQRLASVTKAVTNTAQKALKKVQQVKQAVNTRATQAKKAVQAKLKDLKKQANRVKTQIQKKLSSKWDDTRRTFKKVKRQIRDKVQAVTRKAKLKFNTLKAKASQKIKQVQTAAKKTFKAIKTRVTTGIQKGKTALKTGFQTLKTKASSALNQAKAAAKTGFNTLKAKASAGWKAGKTAVTNGLKKAGGAVTKLAKSKPLLALLAAGGTAVAGYKAIQSIRKGGLKQLGQDIKKKAGVAWKWLKSPEGIATVARVGVTTAITIGAAALTVGTGGLAAPLLIMAAGGAVSGAAGKLTQNAILKKIGDPKKYAKTGYLDGITAKSMLGDAALGAVLGPAGALVGGMARQVVGNVGRYAMAPAAKLLGSAGRTFIKGIRGIGRSRTAASATRSSVQASARRATRQATRAAVQDRAKALWKDFSGYNSKLWTDTKKDVSQSFYGGLGLGGKASQTEKVFGSREQLRVAQLRVARDKVRTMDHAEVLGLASQLRLRAATPINELRKQVALRLARTNHAIVSKEIQAQARQKVKNEVKANLKDHWFGAPRQAGESTARLALRRTGRFLTGGIRANVKNVAEKDAEFAEQLAKGKVAGASYLAGATANEVTKMNLMSYLRSGNLVSGKPTEQATDGFIQAVGGTPDMFKEKAIGSLLGFDAGFKSITSAVGAGNVDAGLQFEDKDVGDESAKGVHP